MKMDLRWRPARLSDPREAADVVALMEGLYAEDLGQTLPPEQARKTLQELAASPAAGTLYVAEESSAPERLAGYALVIRYLSNEFGGYIGYLDEFFLEPAARRQGHGSRLLAGLIDLAGNSGLTALWLEAEPHNANAQRLYARHGFAPAPRVFMRRSLADQAKPLPDLVDFGLKVLFVGYNPSLRSAALGHHFAGHSNRFWELLFRSGLTPEKLRPEGDHALLALGCGVTNLVDRPTRAIDELARAEYHTGAEALRQRLVALRPQVVALLGKEVYRTYARAREPIAWGRQEKETVPGVVDFVLPNPSGLNRMTMGEQLAPYRQLHEYLATGG
jgi:TDG/mug DNA glycosylase family protein